MELRYDMFENWSNAINRQHPAAGNSSSIKLQDTVSTDAIVTDLIKEYLSSLRKMNLLLITFTRSAVKLSNLIQKQQHLNYNVDHCALSLSFTVKPGRNSLG